jgi:DNA-binding GntR family transcriptional regulator
LVEQLANHPPRVARLSPGDIAEIYDVRLELEAAAAELAARALDDAALARLRRGAEAVAAARGKVGWAERALEFDLEFHREIAVGCGNRRLAGDIERYRRLVRSFCRLTGSEQNLAAAWQEHLEILTALEARRPAAARKAMAAHIRCRKQAVLAELAGNSPNGSTT